MRSTPRRAALVALFVMAGTLPAAAQDSSSVPRISLTDFKKLHDEDKVLVIDTRSAESYRGGHIPGAISVPLSAWDREPAPAEGDPEADRRLLCLTVRAHQRPCGAIARRGRSQEREGAPRRMERLGRERLPRRQGRPPEVG